MVIAYDPAFYEHLPKLFPHRDVTHIFADDPALAEITAFRNGTLQGAYLMLAARALGLDCGPLSGFDNQMLDKLLFNREWTRSNFICGIGYGDTSKLFERHPRFEFEQICRVI